MRRSRYLLPLAMLLIWAGGCSSPPPGGLPTTHMRIGSRTFILEIANSFGTRETGLMRRDSMPRDHGMIFVFPWQQESPFWMKNTRFPLDILFIDKDGRVVSIHRMEAYDEHSTYSGGAYKYAVEINAGEAEKTGVKAGDVLEIPKEAHDP